MVCMTFSFPVLSPSVVSTQYKTLSREIPIIPQYKASIDNQDPRVGRELVANYSSYYVTITLQPQGVKTDTTENETGRTRKGKEMEGPVKPLPMRTILKKGKGCLPPCLQPTYLHTYRLQPTLAACGLAASSCI